LFSIMHSDMLDAVYWKRVARVSKCSSQLTNHHSQYFFFLHLIPGIVIIFTTIKNLVDPVDLHPL